MQYHTKYSKNLLPYSTPSVSNKTNLDTAHYERSWSQAFKKSALLTILITLTACQSKINDLPQIEEINLPEKWQTVPATARDDQQKTATPDSTTVIVEPKPVKKVENGWLNNFDDP